MNPMPESTVISPERATVELSVVMPCLNEARTVGTCVGKAVRTLEELNVQGEVIVADNGSTDGSQEIARRYGARVIHADRKGYGAALQAGIAAARGTYIVMGDADDSYDFTQLEPFLKNLRAGDELVMGNRFRGGIKDGAMPWHHRYIGNPVLSTILNIFFRSPIRDAHCGLRAFRKDSYERLGLTTPGMEFASEMVVKACFSGLRISEVPVVLHPDGRDRPPHLRSFRDGWRHLRFLILHCPLWLYLVPSCLLSGFGLFLMLWLTPGPRVLPGGVSLDVHTMLLGSLCLTLGYQTLWLWVSAKIFGLVSGLLPSRAIHRKLFSYFNLERGLACGLAMLLLGLGANLALVWSWYKVDFGPLTYQTTLRYAIWGVTAIIMGAQTIFGSFFLSILGLLENERTE